MNLIRFRTRSAALPLVALLLLLSACRQAPPPETDQDTAEHPDPVTAVVAAEAYPTPASPAAPRVLHTELHVDAASRSRRYPAARRIHQPLVLPVAGRYALLATGEQTVGVQWVDRMTGPSPVRPQRSDGFFSAGPLKGVLHGHEEVSGEIELAVHAFTERHAEPYPRLPELRLLETTLADFEQRSWWLVIDSPRWVTIEMAGRHLADLRLWRDGEWLTEAIPEQGQIDPEGGRPLQWRLLHTRLEPGLYRLSAYGGPGQPWSEESDRQPLYVRNGIPEMPAYGWWSFETSPFGVDRWLIDSDANAFELRLEQAEPAGLAIAAYDQGTNPSGAGGQAGQLDHDARQPEIFLAHTHRGQRLITVTARPGRHYRLSALHHATRYSLDRPGNRRHWIGVAGINDPRDTIEATVAALDTAAWQRGERQLLAEQLPVLSADTAWRGRFNLLQEVSLLLRVNEGGDYVTELAPDSEAMAAFRIEPLFESVPRGRATGWQSGSSHQWALEPGLYQLSLRPDAGHPGIAELHLRPAGQPAAHTGESATADGLVPVQPGRHRVIQLNDFDHGRGGLVIRPLPLTLDQALPVTHAPGITRSFDISARAGHTLVATAPDGGPVELALADNGPWHQELVFTAAASRTVYVRHPREHAVIYNLHWLPDSDGVFTPEQLPATSAEDLARRQSDPMPVLDETDPLLLDMPRGGYRSHRLRVTEPALYQLESTGLLDTRGELRDRIHLDLAMATAGGSGRNFLIQRYLRDGEYRLVSRALGRSAGPLGLRLRRAPLVDAGTLPLEAPARATVQPGQALRYRFHIDRSDTYTVHARGLEQDFAVQLDGPDGWPVIRPGSATPLDIALEPGLHELVLIPQAVTARAVTTVSARPAPAAKTEGHGPHPLALNRPQAHLWREPAKPDTTRQPDHWQFDLPAAMGVRIHPGADMAATLYTADQGVWRKLDELHGADAAWRELDAGGYRLAVRAARVDDRREYSVAIHTRELPVGQERRLNVPGEVALSLSETLLVRIASLSALDVQAELLDAQGQRLAFSDHRPDDWNFLISQALPAGRYRLVIGTPDDRHGQALIRVDRPEIQAGGTLAVGDSRQLQGSQGAVYPLALPAQVPVHGFPLVVLSRSHATHGVALEMRRDDQWATVYSNTGRDTRGGLVLDPTALALEYRLRVWPLDDVAETIALALHGPARNQRSPPRSGYAGSRIDDHALLGLKRLEQAGMARIDSERAALAGWQWAGAGGAFRPVRAGWLPLTGEFLWLLGDHDAELPAVASVTAGPEQVLAMPIGDRVGVAVERNRNTTTSLRVWHLHSPLAPPTLQPEPAPGTGWALAIPEQDSAVAVALPGQSVQNLKLGRADGDSRARRMTLSEHRLSVEDHGRFDGDVRNLLLPPGTAARVQLAGDERRDLQLTLPATVAAISADRDHRISQVFWSGNGALNLHAAPGADRLWLANIGPDEASVRLLRPAPTTLLAQSGGYAMGARFGFAGVRVLRLQDLAGQATLHFGGDLVDAVLVDDSGLVHVMEDGRIALPPSGAGRLYLHHGTYPFGIWMGEVSPGTGATPAGGIRTPTESGPDPFGIWMGEVSPGTGATPAGGIRTPTESDPDPFGIRMGEVSPGMGATPAGGIRTPTESGGIWTPTESGALPREERRFASDQPVLLQFTAREPGLLHWFPPDGPDSTHWLDTDQPLVRLLAPGEYRYGYTPLPPATDPVWPEPVRVPLVPLHEGVGRPVRLGAGQSQAFVFELEQARAIGLGVQTEREVVTVELMDAGGRVLGHGIVQLHDRLPAGRYVLHVRLPADQPPVTVRPTLVGSQAPDDIIPDEIRQQLRGQ